MYFMLINSVIKIKTIKHLYFRTQQEQYYDPSSFLISLVDISSTLS